MYPYQIDEYISSMGYGTYLAYRVNIDKQNIVAFRDEGGHEFKFNGGRMCMNKG